jgi:hypothetical protein
MEPGSISLTRTLPIDGALLADVLLRLRRDTEGSVVRWTLGDRGTAEVDTVFITHGPTWTTAGRVWSPSGLALAPVTLEITVTADAVQLVLRPSAALPPCWRDRTGELVTLARAVVDELGEELLWHAALSA